MKKIIPLVMSFMLSFSMAAPVIAKDKDEIINLSNGTEMTTENIVSDQNLKSTEIFYMEDGDKKIPYKQEVYEVGVPIQKNMRTGVTSHKKVAMAVITEGTEAEGPTTRGSGSKKEEGWDRSASFHFYASLYYNTRSESNGATSYCLTRLTGDAVRVDSSVSLTSYSLNYGQTGIKSGTTGGVTQRNSKTISGSSFDFKQDHGWYYVYEWQSWYDFSIGQTQYYTLKRGSSTWSGMFQLNL